MAKIIYRVLDSQDKSVTILDEFILKTDEMKYLPAYWRKLVKAAKRFGLFIKDGIFTKRDGTNIVWMEASTKGGSSIRRYEFDLNQH